MLWILAHLLFFPAHASAAQALQSRDPLKTIADAGRRNLQWFKNVNQVRTRKHLQPLELYSEFYGEGIISQNNQTPQDPQRYSADLLWYEYRQVLAQAPQSFVKRISGQVPFGSDQAGLKDKTFLYWSSTVANIYDFTARWNLSKETWEDQAKEAVNDIRGYLLLNRDSDIEAKLKNFGLEISPAQKPLHKALLQLCRNSGKSIEDCALEFNADPGNSVDANPFYQRYLPAGQKIWDTHFQISTPRTDIQWTSQNSDEADLVFADPGDLGLRQWLKDSIESAWKWGNWQLKIIFLPDPKSLFPHLRFEAGVTPTTDDLGNIITLDKNIPLDQDGLVTTLRHEFGHVLGFPDCYVEFYDSFEKMMVFYSLDQENLMCNEDGKVLETHYQELKRVYYRE